VRSLRGFDRYSLGPRAVESQKRLLDNILGLGDASEHSRSARVRRESYVGTWLPEPVLKQKVPSMVRQTEMAESLSMAFLLILEALSPIERAVFLLREVFDYEYKEISQIVEKTEENCRQIFARAKRHIEAGKPRFEASVPKARRLGATLFHCMPGREPSGLTRPVGD
jgi:RNA polymerase sigma-70 factor, ECF subfamily